ncbi:MAG: InlB B-repeat-containing protein, partial [Clostridia bacterium]|nr:InlB B-repeat-containing protein [Clostridia bacterium]
MKKRIISFIICIVMLFCTIPFSASAAITPGKPKYGSASGYGTSFTLTGNQANDVIAVAKAQVYKSGSTLGYSGAWCDAFVIDCARIANVSTSVIPNTRGCLALYNAILNNGGQKVTTPQAGDVVLYYCSTCKNYPHIGFYAGSGYTCEGNVGGSVSNSNRTKIYYQDGSGHTSKSTIKSLYVRPKYASATYHTLNFNGNGGTGSMSSMKVAFNSDLTMPANTFKYPGYTFKGWNALRSDGKWHCVGQGWKTEAEIKANNYTKSVYADGLSYSFNQSWTNGTTGSITVTFYAQWAVADYTVNFWYNHSGRNYFRNSDFTTIDTTLYKSRDTSVYTISKADGRNGTYGSMKIVGASAGALGKDLLWRTSTMGNNSDNGYVGDNKILILSFWAKSSVANAKFYVRFGYQSADALKSVTLSTDWKYYTITMSKDEACGHDLHPYFDKAGTFYISELQIEDGVTATTFVPEKQGFESAVYRADGVYSPMPTPKREGYNFEGWYTSASGGQKITEKTPVKYGMLNLYAAWSKKTSATPVSIKITKAPDKLNYYIGDTVDVSGMEVSVTYSDGTVNKLSNSDVELQNAKLKAEGEKKITVVYGEFNDTFTVNIKSPKITLSDYELRLKKGEQHSITVTTDPSDVTVKDDTSDKRIATIDEGIVTAVDTGEAEITIRFTYNGLTYKAVCKVIVENTGEENKEDKEEDKDKEDKE